MDVLTTRAKMVATVRLVVPAVTIANALTELVDKTALKVIIILFKVWFAGESDNIIIEF